MSAAKTSRRATRSIAKDAVAAYVINVLFNLYIVIADITGTIAILAHNERVPELERPKDGFHSV